MPIVPINRAALEFIAKRERYQTQLR